MMMTTTTMFVMISVTFLKLLMIWILVMTQALCVCVCVCMWLCVCACGWCVCMWLCVLRCRQWWHMAINTVTIGNAGFNIMLYLQTFSILCDLRCLSIRLLLICMHFCCTLFPLPAWTWCLFNLWKMVGRCPPFSSGWQPIYGIWLSCVPYLVDWNLPHVRLQILWPVTASFGYERWIRLAVGCRKWWCMASEEVTVGADA